MSADGATTPASTVERTPRGRRLRALGGWALVVVLVLVAAFTGMRIAASPPGPRGALDPESVGPGGALALADILRDQGVTVEVFRSRAQARAALDGSTTLVTTNPYALTDDGLGDLMSPADRVVFLSAGTHLLTTLGIGDIAPGNSAPVSAGCDAAAFAQVGAIRPDRLFVPAAGVQGCFGGPAGAAVLMAEREGRRLALVDGTKLLSNAYLAEDGNAALGLALLGQSPRVVWYVPSLDDSDVEGQAPETLGSLTPGWVTPVILLLLVAGLAAALWRGRRFGPLVAETLPVTVRASETMHGRARLTAKAADAAHAAQALREGTQRRLARRLGLAAHATPDEVADAAADRLRIPRGSLSALFSGPLPDDDHGLVPFTRRLDELETAVDTAGHVEGAPRDEYPDEPRPPLRTEAEDTT